MSQHKWYMGWPGNFCTKCGMDDQIELAIGNADYDPYNDSWVSEEAKAKYDLTGVCPAKDKETK